MFGSPLAHSLITWTINVNFVVDLLEGGAAQQFSGFRCVDERGLQLGRFRCSGEDTLGLL